MRRFLFSIWMMLMVLALVACSDSTEPEDQTPTITGTVTTASGQPVVGASILVSFRPSFDEYLQPVKSFSRADLDPYEGIWWLKITNACGDTIRTLCDDDCNFPQTIIWDGLDDEGLRVVEGLYTMVLDHTEGLVTQDMILIHDYHEWDLQECSSHARTDDLGEFQLTDECLGFGSIITVTDENGDILDECPIQRLVSLHAVDGNGNVALRDSVLFPLNGNLELDFVLGR